LSERNDTVRDAVKLFWSLYINITLSYVAVNLISLLWVNQESSFVNLLLEYMNTYERFVFCGWFQAEIFWNFSMKWYRRNVVKSIGNIVLKPV